MRDNQRFYIFVVLSLAIAYSWLTFQLIYTGNRTIVVCPCKLIWGIPCVGCGLTRATLLFFKGELLKALMFNPNVILIITYLTFMPLLVTYDIFTGNTKCKKIFDKIDNSLKKKYVFFSFIICELSVWCHNIIIQL